MKIKVAGDTPMQRLTNLMRGILAVPKSEIKRAQIQKGHKKPLRRKRTA